MRNILHFGVNNGLGGYLPRGGHGSRGRNNVRLFSGFDVKEIGVSTENFIRFKS